MHRISVLIGLAGCLAGLAVPGAADLTTVLGTVVDASHGNSPCAGAVVVVDASPNSTLTSSQGFYLLENMQLNTANHQIIIWKSGLALFRQWNPPHFATGATNTVNASLFVGGQIAGHVKYQDTGAAAAGVTVVASVIGAPNYSPLTSTVTDVNGAYLLSAVYPFPVDVAAAGTTGYANALRSNISVQDQQTTSGVDLELQPGGGLQGTVEDAFGGAVLGATVTLYPDSGNTSFQQAMQTDTAGKYSFKSVSAGNYSLKVAPPQGQNLQTVQTGGVRIQAWTMATRNFTLQPGGILQGTVQGQNGPLSNAKVGLYIDMQYPFGVLFNAKTDVNGQYVLDGLSPDQSYALQVKPPPGDTDHAQGVRRGIIVPEGATLLQDFALSWGGGQQGQVRDPLGQTVATGSPVIMNDREIIAGDFDEEASLYRLQGADEGDYLFVLVSGIGNYATWDGYMHVTPRVIANQDLELVPGGAVEGWVFDNQGNSLAGVKIAVKNKMDLLASIDYLDKAAYSDSSGYYRLEGLSPGEYALTASPAAPDAGGPACSHAATLAITGNVLLRQDFHLPTGARVFGTVRDVYNNRIRNAYVYFWNNSLSVWTRADQWGNYALMLAPGSYFCQAYYTSLLGANLAMQPDANVIVPAAPEFLQRDCILQTGGTLSGKITDQVGQGVSLAKVRVYESNHPAPARVAVSGPGGDYQVQGLYSGPFTVQVEADGYSPALAQAGVTLGSQSQGVNVSIVAQTSIAGSVQDQQNRKPLAQALVQAWDGAGNLIQQTATNAAGQYILPALTGGPFQVKAGAAGLKSQTQTGLYPGSRADFFLEPLIGKDEAISYPNPCRHNSLTFLYWLENNATVLIRVYNQAGELVWDWEGPGQAQQFNKHVWQVQGVAPGVYIYKITARRADNGVQSFPAGRLTVIK